MQSVKLEKKILPNSFVPFVLRVFHLHSPLFIIFLSFYGYQVSAATDQVSIQLKWKHGFQFAGYYAAIEKGFYHDAGLDVSLKEIDFSRDIVEQVISGESEYGVSDSALLIYHLKGKPVVLVNQIFQHSPLVFLSHRKSNIISPYKMVGKTVAFNSNNQGDAPLNALLISTLGDLSNINEVSHGTPYYQNFIDGKTDVVSAYSTSQPYLLKEQGIEVNIINPQNYGIDFYGDNFFTSQEELEAHPERVKKMSQATIKGWQYALDHPDEIITLIREKYDPSLSEGYLQYEARTTREMIIPDLIKLGSVDPKRYQKTAEDYRRSGFTDTHRISKHFYYDRFDHDKIKLTAEEEAWIKAHPLIRLGTETNWPPYDFIDKSGKFKGLSADVIRLVEQRLGIQFKIISQYPWAETLEKVKSHEIDMISSIALTAERQQFLRFTEFYAAPPTVIFIRKDNSTISSLDDLKGQIVSIENQYYLHKRLADEYPDIVLLPVSTTADALKALSHGKAEAYVGNQGVGNWIIEQNALTNLKVTHDAGLDSVPLRLGVRKDWPLFQGILNKALASISDAELLVIRRKWLGIESTTNRISLSASEQQWLNQHKQIRFTGDPNWLPYEAFDKQGNYIGIAAEYLKLIEKKLGINVEIIPTKTWNESVFKVKQGEIDVLSETSDSALKSHLTFTQAYLSSPVVIIMKNDEDYVADINQIKQKKIAVIKEYGYVSEIIKKYPDLGLHEVESIQDGLTAVSTGKFDALIATLAQASYHISELSINNIRIVGKTQFNTKLAFGMQKEFAPLVPLFNRALDSISQSEKQHILKAWGKQKFATKTNYELLAKIAVIFMLIIAVFIFWNRKMAAEINRRKQVENQTQALIDNIPLQIIVTSQDGHILSANPKALTDNRINKDEIESYNISNFYQDSRDRQMILKELSEHGKVEQKIIPFKMLDDTVHSMMISIIPITYFNTNAFVTISVDMTERLEIEAALQKAKENAESANRAKSEFLSNMSHEIRTPMNAIIGFTELLNDQIKEPKLKSFVKTIHSAGNNLLALINDILDLSKIEAGKFQIEKTPCNPHDLFTELGNIFMMKMGEKNIELILDIDPEIPQSLQMDAARLRQVLFNLIGNAVKFTEQGFVRVKAYTDNEDQILSKLDLLIDVEDTGIGISENQQQQVFHQFEQSSGQDVRKYGGTGLGLSISDRLVQLMGGQITLKSQLGKGSIFTIRLPDVHVASLAIEALNVQSVKSPIISFLPGDILIVDDVKDNRDLLLANFAETELRVTQAENGMEAVNLAKQQDFDLILMDIRMPVMDGYQAAREIKAFSNVPIIALTASVMTDDFERIKSNNFQGYLRKPVLQKDLVAELSRFLPFNEILETEEQHHQDEIVVLSAEESALLPELLVQLKKLLPHCEMISETNNINEIKKFAEALLATQQKQPVAIVNEYASNLNSFLDSFDIAAIRRSVNEYPQLVAQLEEKTQSKNEIE